jgi:citrate synthase
MSTAQVARRLGVKPETVYAYVSRGLLRSTRQSGGRGSWFDPAEVERLSARATARAGGSPEIRTGLTLVADGRLYYRGMDVTALARSHRFESVAVWLWSGEDKPDVSLTAPPEAVRRGRMALAALPATARLTDRLRTIVAVAAAADPLRFHTQPVAVAATGGAVLAAMVDALPLLGPPPAPGDLLAARLWPRLTGRPAEPADLDVLNAALVLLADHDLAASTVAARVAASTRAHPYAVVAAGLAALDGPLHGAAVTQAYRVVADAVETGDPLAVYSERLRTDGRVAGFADHVHPLYPRGDIRGTALLELLGQRPVPAAVRAAVDGLAAAASDRSARRPTIDFAIAALAHAYGMASDAGEAIFAVARTAGWIAHAIEEYREPGLRFRLSGTYTGAHPG